MSKRISITLGLPSGSIVKPSRIRKDSKGKDYPVADRPLASDDPKALTGTVRYVEYDGDKAKGKSDPKALSWGVQNVPFGLLRALGAKVSIREDGLVEVKGIPSTFSLVLVPGDDTTSQVEDSPREGKAKGKVEPTDWSSLIEG
jgi:hypothetical protein